MAVLEAFAPPEKPARGHVLVETECTLISPGTERALLLNLTDDKAFPKHTGYSAVGRITATSLMVGFFRVCRLLSGNVLHAPIYSVLPKTA